jgi:hypothetical protein
MSEMETFGKSMTTAGLMIMISEGELQVIVGDKLLAA